MSRRNAFLITCEHAGNRVPEPYRTLFDNHKALLASHRGYDPGALLLARELAEALDTPLIYATVSRLLIDLNRSPGHPRLYSDITRRQPEPVRRRLFTHYYLPYRNRIDAHVYTATTNGARLVHIASHSFTPVLDGQVRQADVGLLYDPARVGERALCTRWQTSLKALPAGWTVRRNYPYAGRSDGLTAWLRRRYAEASYVGIELEINHKHVLQNGDAWQRLRRDVIRSLVDTLQDRDDSDGSG